MAAADDVIMGPTRSHARRGRKREMGAVLWSILALIFVLLSLPNASIGDHAGGYYDEQILAVHGHGRQTRDYNDDDDMAQGTSWIARGWSSCEECRENGSRSDTERMLLEMKFLARINESIQSVFQRFSGTILVHAGTDDGDVLLYWKGDSSENRTLKCIPADLYRRLKILSHLPVEAAAIALENMTNISDATQDLKQRLNQSRSLLDLTENQERILRMVNESLRNDRSSILDSLKNANYEEPLTQIAKDAVKDYLLDLNRTIEVLNVDMDADIPNSRNIMTVVVYHRQFAYPESFIVQYYKLLFNYNVRIVLRPTGILDKDEYCSSFDGNCSNVSISAASSVTFERSINDTFSRLNSRYNSSIHGFMDAQTEQIICQDLNFGFEACPEPDSSLPGFQSRIEKAYVVLFVFFGACSVMLGIVLLAVCYEDRVMKAEGNASTGNKMLNNRSRQRHLSAISMQSNEEG